MAFTAVWNRRLSFSVDVHYMVCVVRNIFCIFLHTHAMHSVLHTLCSYHIWAEAHSHAPCLYPHACPGRGCVVFIYALFPHQTCREHNGIPHLRRAFTWLLPPRMPPGPSRLLRLPALSPAQHNAHRLRTARNDMLQQLCIWDRRRPTGCTVVATTIPAPTYAHLCAPPTVHIAAPHHDIMTANLPRYTSYTTYTWHSSFRRWEGLPKCLCLLRYDLLVVLRTSAWTCSHANSWQHTPPSHSSLPHFCYLTRHCTRFTAAALLRAALLTFRGRSIHTYWRRIDRILCTHAEGYPGAF